MSDVDYVYKLEWYLNSSKLYRLYLALKDAFVLAPAGKTMHHNFSGGLARHTVEMIEFGLNNLAELISTDTHKPLIDPAEFINACFLHDLAKVEFYKTNADNSIEYVKHPYVLQEMVVQNYCARHGIELTENEINALWLAEGDFSPVFRSIERTPLAVALHICDLYSSQLLNPRMVIQAKCPVCGTGDIVAKTNNGTGNTFYACNRYPDCRTIVNDPPKSILIENNYELPVASSEQ